MHPQQAPSARINPATEPMQLPPLTPDEWERNQAIYDKVRGKVLGDDEPEKQ